MIGRVANLCGCSRDRERLIHQNLVLLCPGAVKFQRIGERSLGVMIAVRAGRLPGGQNVAWGSETQ